VVAFQTLACELREKPAGRRTLLLQPGRAVTAILLQTLLCSPSQRKLPIRWMQVNTGFYDGVHFHRVIKDFMLQVRDAKSSLGDAKSSLGDATSSLGDATSSLGDAKSSLGDAKSSLGDAESSLG
jgi:hypothetical protein